MTASELIRRELAAVAVATHAGWLALTGFRKGENYRFKGPQNYVTETDTAVEGFIAARLAEAFPDDGFLGEESGGRRARALWIVDPIDGTAQFARGTAHFCVSVAFVLNGTIEVGVIVNPVAGETFCARRGRGATLNGHPLQVSTVTDPDRAVVEVGTSTSLPLVRQRRLARVFEGLGSRVRNAGSGALGLASVAAGRQDAYAEVRTHAWDAAAGVLLVREAGGWTNDFLTPSCLTKGNRVLACTPSLAQAFAPALLV